MTKPTDDKKVPGPGRNFRNKIMVWGSKALVAVVPRLPIGFWQFVGKVLGALASFVPGRRRTRLRDHLEIAYPSPEYSDAYRAKLLRASCQSLVNLFFEGIWASGWKEPDNRRVELLEPQRWEELRAYLESDENKGLVIYTAHLGTFEVVGRWFCNESPKPVMAVASKPKVPEIAEMLREVRQKVGYRLVWRGDAGLATMRHLRAGGVLVMLVDHNLKGPGVAVPFFGKDAHTLLAPARLALQSGARATTAFCLRQGLGKFQVFFEEPLALPPYPRQADERLRVEADLAATYTRRIEDNIRQHPEQYLWMHKRWQKRSDTLPFPD